MQDPYNYPFLQKTNTMYLSTITKNDFASRTGFTRESSFQKRDIEGSLPKTLAPKRQTQTNMNLSTYVEPVPDRYKHIQKKSDPLRIDDIQGARPKAHDFKTSRIVDPLQPIYKLPRANQISMDPGRNFIRNPLSVQDINSKKGQFVKQRGVDILKQPVDGSHPKQLTKQIKAKQRLQVQDIIKDGIFETTRHINPLKPQYKWRDDDRNNNSVNEGYGQIPGNAPRRLHPATVNKVNDFKLNTRDIEGTTSNSTFNRSHFIDKRKEFRNYMNTNDIQKCGPSSLKKGIETMRKTNPLMPNYKFPGHSEMGK